MGVFEFRIVFSRSRLFPSRVLGLSKTKSLLSLGKNRLHLREVGVESNGCIAKRPGIAQMFGEFLRMREV